MSRRRPSTDAPVAAIAPTSPWLEEYDDLHIKTYLRLLDADAAGADWRDVARIVLRLDPDNQPWRARLTYETHLARARWMTTDGYRFLVARWQQRDGTVA